MTNEKVAKKKKSPATGDEGSPQQRANAKQPVKHLNLRRKKDLNFVLNDVALEQRGYFSYDERTCEYIIC